MSQVYTLPGAVRWRSHDGSRDVRSHRVHGWRVEPMELTHHPITGRRFRGGVCQWWFKETKVDGASGGEPFDEDPAHPVMP
ncbi:hypothetical protein IP93_02009 [Lysobacter ruishenii]|uniref:Uncharacterized protein n=1 Tax=Aerolutibacter ruishenii TaxID=686800 RepID=A0A562LP95_9GAMM|nr:hypothetical protein IP93_02009 [Lysobacter ruishenii]